MDFPFAPLGWKPLTIEEKRQKEKERLAAYEKRYNVMEYPLTELEQQWNVVRSIAEEHGKKKEHVKKVK